MLLGDVNDGPEQAHELGALLRGRDVVQNLIPWNPVYRCASVLPHSLHLRDHMC